MQRWGGAALVAVFCLAGCAQTTPRQAPPRADALDALPGWRQDRVADAMPALLRGCARLMLAPVDQKLGTPAPPDAARMAAIPSAAWQAGSWRTVCADARAVPPDDEAAARAFFARDFQPVPLGDPDGLFTGYDEPELAGSREKTRATPVGVLRRPDDLVEQTDAAGHRRFGQLVDGALVPYASRAEIDAGALRRQRLDLAYLHSPIDLFFLQIQGSGRIELPNGHEVRVGYAATNGQPYVPIGRAMAERGDLSPDAISAASIRAWLVDHPRAARATMELNPSYTFFRETPDLDPALGPLGTLGVQLTPLRSVAVDPQQVPLGAPVWIDTTGPDGAALQRMAVAQDTGSAIVGRSRIDIFFGWGPAAEDAAGRMRARGRAWVLLPKPPAGA